MVRSKRGEKPSLTAEQIKAAAHQLMSENGTAGISLRGIARALGVTAPAIYNYFSRLEDLITALIVDAYSDLAQDLETAADDQAGDSPGERLLAVLLAYREWALANPVEFTLIYGNPIPGYYAPASVTTPAARRGFAVILGILAEAEARGLLKPGEEPFELPKGLRVSLPAIGDPGEGLPPLVVYTGVMGWYHIHGMIMLELFNHIRPLVNDPGLFYEYEVRNLLKRVGLK